MCQQPRCRLPREGGRALVTDADPDAGRSVGEREHDGRDLLRVGLLRRRGEFCQVAEDFALVVADGDAHRVVGVGVLGGDVHQVAAAVGGGGELLTQQVEDREELVLGGARGGGECAQTRAPLVVAAAQNGRDELVLDVAARLTDPALEAAVREDERLAEYLGLRGVPLLVVGDQAITGAVETEALVEVLERHATRPPTGARCEDGVCSL
ncbi:DsbA family protein [Streptomyces sp. NPDC021354]|uniref:DsbA family protein n=1 Tax=Streptomyces sp. NPDC021354 TaxID=3154793 RepID=UPI0033E30ABE